MTAGIQGIITIITVKIIINNATILIIVITGTVCPPARSSLGNYYN